MNRRNMEYKSRRAPRWALDAMRHDLRENGDYSLHIPDANGNELFGPGGLTERGSRDLHMPDPGGNMLCRA